jgi:methylamine--corrinoid protein Co-methyltransferase
MLKEVTKKYGITYDSTKMVPYEDDVLDRIFQAAKELVVKCGVLVVDTERLIEFQEWEIDQALNSMHDQVTLGSGADAITINHRNFEEYDEWKNPVCVEGRILGTITDDVYEEVCMSFAQEDLIDYVHFQGVLPEIYGMPVVPNTPWEMWAEMKSLAIVKDVCRRACRPGLSDGGNRPITARGQMVGANPSWGMQAGDVRSCNITPHMKSDMETFCKALMWHQYGALVWGTFQGYVGGASGGPATSAVNGCAEAIAFQMLYEWQIGGSWAVDALYFSNSSKTALWVNNYGLAAFHKNTHTPSGVGGAWQMVAGIGAEECFWEHAAGTISATVLGQIVSGGTGHQSGGPNHACGLLVRFAAEVGQAVAKARLTRRDANELVCRIMPKYQPGIDERNLHKKGGDFKECYDVKRVLPKPWYLELYNKVKKELTEMGLPMVIT